jgi:hypothetical protein
MALPSSGPISLSMIQTEFGGSNPIALSEYYKNGPYVTATDYAPNVPTSGPIALSNFYGAQNNSLQTIEFTTVGTTTYTIPSTLQGDITYLIVGGGGGGSAAGADEGGGAGGAGGVITRTGTFVPGETITVTVGGGGALYVGGSNTTLTCSLGTITALGGGHGGFQTGQPGGSGGGAGGANGFHNGGAGLQPSQGGLDNGLGNNGGNCPQSDNFPGGGGGGAGGGGGTGGSNNGGAPIANPISGSTVGYNISGTYYVGGGGSGRYIGQPHLTYTAGSGYGGDGSWGYPSKANGTAGASGCVIIQGYW